MLLQLFHVVTLCQVMKSHACEPSFKAIGWLKVSNDTEHASVQLKPACEFHLLMESYTLVLK